MRTFVIAAIAAVALVAINTSTSAAADNAGQVPASMLASLGAGTLQHLSDVQGMDIRGKGTRSGGCIQSCVQSCRPSCERSCQSSCERPSCETKSRCVPVCRPKCGGGIPGGSG